MHGENRSHAMTSVVIREIQSLGSDKFDFVKYFRNMIQRKPLGLLVDSRKQIIRKGDKNGFGIRMKAGKNGVLHRTTKCGVYNQERQEDFVDP